MKKLLVLITLLGLTIQGNASNESNDKEKILKMMKEYTKLVSCMHSFEENPETGRPTTLKDVHTVEYNETSKVFYILWSGDIGCNVGSGTVSSFVTEVARHGGGDWRPYTVQTDYAFGDNIAINYKYIESIKKINHNSFEVISWDYADDKYGGVDGGSNFPANKFRYTLERDRFEPWKIKHQSLLEQNQ